MKQQAVLGFRILAGDVFCAMVQAEFGSADFQEFRKIAHEEDIKGRLARMRKVAIEQAALLLDDVDQYVIDHLGDPRETAASAVSEFTQADASDLLPVLDSEFGGI